MKTHTNNFKQEIKRFGRQVDSKITIGSTVLGKNELNAVTPSYQGALLKSVMKELNIDSNVDIPLNSILNYKFGVKVNGEYEYLNFGNYVVYKVEKQEDTRSYNITCYDKMLYSMVEYKALQHGQFPMTIREYLKNLCLDCGLTFKNENDEFANYDKILEDDPYSELEYTYRDVFDELSQVTASTICLDDNDKVEVRYITETNDVIDEEYLKDVNVNFGEKYGKINSIVLSRSGESDNVYLRDETSVRQDGLCELKIIDNQIMNFNNRSDYLPDILEKLNGLEYYLNDFTSTGITYYDVCDRYSVKVGDKTYSCVMFNDEINVTQGLEEIVYTEMPKETQTDYTKADKTDRKINQAYIIVDKQNQEIQALASKVVDLSTTETGKGQVAFQNATLGALGKISITGNVELFYPAVDEYGGMSVKSGIYKSGMVKASSYKTKSQSKYPSDDLFPRDTYLVIKQEDKEDVEYHLPIKRLNSTGSVSDEFIWEYNKMKIIHRVGIATNGDYYVLAQPYEEDLGELEITIPEGDGYFVFESFPFATISITYMLKNEYTETFSTKVEMKSEIKVATDEINLEVAKKVDSGEIISAINLSPEEIAIDSKKIALEGYTTINNGFSVDLDGNMTANNGKFTGGKINLYDDGNAFGANLNLYNSSNSNEYNQLYSDWIFQYTNGKAVDIQNGGVRTYGDYYNSFERGRLTYSKVVIENESTESTMTPNGVWSPNFNNNSLESKKKNIDFDNGCLQEILDTDICSFNWKYEDDTDQKHIGCIINDDGGNYKVSPKVLTHDKDAIDLYSMSGMSWKAIQELYDIIKLQEQKIKELEERLDGIK